MKIAIDTGGTFTDVLALDEAGRLRSAKFPADSAAPNALFAAARAAVGASGPDEFRYGTTQALNALLAGNFSPVGLIVNRGFRDLLETARLPKALGTAEGLPDHLVPLELVSELNARMDASGDAQEEPDPAEIEGLARNYSERGIATVAISLLHSYRNSDHEHEVANVFARVAPEIEVVLSSEVLPELREYERTLATCLNASLRGVLRGHLSGLSRRDTLLLMQSSGGLGENRRVTQRPFSTAVSGPVAAVVGAAHFGRAMGIDDMISLDIGGTSTDVALIRGGAYELTTRGEVAGFPWKVPMVDVFSIGAGGGSVASDAPDGRWQVGPESAGADPGPICYGKGGERVTLTDAQLVLGRLPESLLGGKISLDVEAARRALAAFGARRGLDAEEGARGLLEIATHQMCGAVRRVSVERGRDPRTSTLFAIGGAGPLHGAELAALLGIETVIVPEQPGLAAAQGLLVAGLREDFVRALGQREDGVDCSEIEGVLSGLEEQAKKFLEESAEFHSSRRILRSFDMRYAGMLYESTIPVAASRIGSAEVEDAIEAFHRHFETLSGYSRRGTEAVEILNVRVTALGSRENSNALQAKPGHRESTQAKFSRPVGFLHHPELLETPIYDRDQLGAGAVVPGPAVVEQYESTLIVPPEFELRVDRFGNAILRSREEFRTPRREN